MAPQTAGIGVILDSPYAARAAAEGLRSLVSMCAVCFTSVQVIPVAAIVARAAWVQRRKTGATLDETGAALAENLAPTHLDAQVPITIS